MHTAEHILTRVMKDHYGSTRNYEMHLGKKKTKCDYDVDKEISQRDIRQLEDLVNRTIDQGLPVSKENIPISEADGYDLWKVPDHLTELTIVRIGDFDATPCAGQHVDNTSQIGELSISSFDRRENGRLRIRFKLSDPK